MAELTFRDLSFVVFPDFVRVFFLKIFYFDVFNVELEKIGRFVVKKSSISFSCSDHKANRKFNMILLKGFDDLTNRITGKKTFYVHQFSDIPLIGSNVFGLIDRNTSIIEVRVLTGCNLNCVYCSVNQDARIVDFVVEKDYLVSEFKKLVKKKRV